MWLSASVAHWYDEKVTPEDNCVLEYYGQRKNFHEFVQDMTDQVVVECDRPEQGLSPPLSAQIAAELSYAKWINRSVWVGLTTDQTSPQVRNSYFGRPATEFWLDHRQLGLAMKQEPRFEGMVVDGYETFKRVATQLPSHDPQKGKHTKRMFGMWVWSEKSIRDPAAQDQLLTFCQTYGIDMLPVQVHIEPGSIQRGQPRLRYPKELRRLIEQASSRGIQIEMLDGAPEMALAENRSAVLAILDVVMAFNKTLPPNVHVAGVHYDIEPYLLPQWESPQREKIMRENLELLEAARLKLKLDAPWMTLSASIPFWYDQKTDPNDHCTVEYNNNRKNFHEHIQDLTDYVAVMSYRREALGDDSIAQHLESERAYAEWIGKYVCAGMETMQIKDHPEVSFFGAPVSEFWFQKQKLDQALGSRGGFGGVVVHSYETFSEYLSRAATEAGPPQSSR